MWCSFVVTATRICGFVLMVARGCQTSKVSADFFTNKSLCSCMHIKFEQLPHTTPHTSSIMRVSYILLVACVFFAVANAARQLGCTYYNGDGCVDSSSAGFVPATATCTTFALNTVTKSWIIDCQNGKMSVKEYDADTCGTVKPAITTDAKLDQCVNATLTSAYCTCNSSSANASISMILAALVAIFSLLF